MIRPSGIDWVRAGEAPDARRRRSEEGIGASERPPPLGPEKDKEREGEGYSAVYAVKMLTDKN